MPEMPAKTDSNPIFIHAWWRSGSTYIWSKLRANASSVCYYEPLHERLASLTPDIVDASPEVDRSMALKHPAQTKNYFAEYSDLLRAGKLKFSPELSYDQYLLMPERNHEDLHTYIESL